MAIGPGTRVGPYEVSALIGEGGMGEVWRAHHLELKRDDALKVLPEAFANDPERLARFRREAQVLASLNHPNIAHVYGLEAADGVQALVMELVEGPTLADRIVIGPIPAAEALRIAKQLAEALEAAHEQGIIHRDLKPANLKVRLDGTVKVLDFGLAKSLAPVASATAVTESTTSCGQPMTRAGILLGTVAYMSPEQARGEAVDKRTDIWAFGCVLYEMLTGRRAFEGPTTAETLAHVLEREPDWSPLAAPTERAIRLLLRRCLQKDTKRRLRDIADARLEIEDWVAERPQDDAADQPAPIPRSRRWYLSTMFAVISLVVGIAVGAIIRRAPSADLEVTRTILDVTPAEDVSTGSVLGVLPGGSSTALAWSPDGRTLAFVGLASGVRRIFLRDLDSETARSLDGTDGAQTFTFSPDGRWIAFSVAFGLTANQEIRKVRIAGGPSAKICDAPRLMPYFPIRVSGISWGSTRIVYTAGHQLFAVSPDGGEPLTLYESKFRVSSPFLLPDDAAVLYTEYEKYWTSGDERVVVQPLTTAAAPKVLERGAADARYLMTGHLAFLRQGTVFVVPFSAESLEIRGAEAAVLKGVAQAVAGWSAADLTLAGQFAISPQGDLAYVASPIPSLPAAELVTVNRRGQVMSLAAPAAAYRGRIELSPDGASVAVPRQTTRTVTLLIYDRVPNTFKSPATQSEVGEAFSPSWSVDGRIAMSVSHGGVTELALFSPDSQAPPQVVSDSGTFFATSWSHDGKRLVGTKAEDLWVYSSNGELSRWTQLTHTESTEAFPVWSPDDRWLAYTSNATGRPEVYVQAYPGPGTAIPVSTNGGVAPAWNPKGRELFYVEGRIGPLIDADQRMMSVDMATPPHPGKPVFLFSFSPVSLPLAMCDPTPCFSVAPNGQEFFAVRMLPRQPVHVTQIRLVSNWFEELKRLVPNQ